MRNGAHIGASLTQLSVHLPPGAPLDFPAGASSVSGTGGQPLVNGRRGGRGDVLAQVVGTAQAMPSSVPALLRRMKQLFQPSSFRLFRATASELPEVDDDTLDVGLRELRKGGH